MRRPLKGVVYAPFVRMHANNTANSNAIACVLLCLIDEVLRTVIGEVKAHEQQAGQECASEVVIVG